ncbi:hypothetical protein BJ508DRAFT_417321 [Ascobolus immersus RN42]|uniref:Uncharacterized protein n=1 Tax=Ascobolus immersus RN42 TaxID=1160509 RepID=A0A3N4HWW0_ASCIM|nr:hypothetical protein BJ508DRAFT_417321 [Ascobolus immersus RN42]
MATISTLSSPSPNDVKLPHSAQIHPVQNGTPGTVPSGFLDRHGRVLNLAANLCLLFSSTVCYVLIILIFLTPSIFPESILYADVSGIKPTVAITLLAGLLAASTLSLLARLVEHHFWLRLRSGKDQGLALHEVRGLANWAISPFARVQYALRGESLLLRVSGLFLLGIAVLGTVLIAGISQHRPSTSTVTTIARAEGLDRFAGWTDDSNTFGRTLPTSPTRVDPSLGWRKYFTLRDTPVEQASIISFAGVSAPAERTICKTDDVNCLITARVGAIQATCDSLELENTVPPVGHNELNGVGARFNEGIYNETSRTFTSALNPALSVILDNPVGNITYANFSTFSSVVPIDPMDFAFGRDTLDLTSTVPIGTYGFIFGAYVPEKHTKQINIVDCQLRFGTISLQQKGWSPPALDRGSFIEATHHVKDEPYLNGTYKIYNFATEDEKNRSPFTFSGTKSILAGVDDLIASSIGIGLLGPYGDAALTAEACAKRIEDAWDMATAMAWARVPGAAEETVVRVDVFREKYRYDWRVLLYLLVPLLATVTGLARTGFRVGGKGEVLGYDPVAIAEKGPLQRYEGDETEGSSARGKGSKNVLSVVHGEEGERWFITSKR